MILKWHMPFYREIFALPELLQSPVLSFGWTTIQGVGAVQVDAPPAPKPFILQSPRIPCFGEQNTAIDELRS